MTWTSDARSVNGWFCAAFGRPRARFEVTRMQSLDRARSQLSIKKRTTKKGGDGEEKMSLAWVCSSSEERRRPLERIPQNGRERRWPGWVGFNVRSGSLNIFHFITYVR